MGGSSYIFLFILLLLGALIILKIIFSILPKLSKAIHYILLGGTTLSLPFLYFLSLEKSPINHLEMLRTLIIFALSGAIYGWFYYRNMNKKK